MAWELGRCSPGLLPSAGWRQCGLAGVVTGLIITFSEFPVPLILLRQHVKQRPGLQLGYVAQLPGLAEIFFRIFAYKDKIVREESAASACPPSVMLQVR